MAGAGLADGLDADPEVVAVAAQPMWLHWATGSGRAVRHAPDFFVRRADGTGVVIDVRAGERIGGRDEAVFAATAQVCAQVGWEFQRTGELGPVHAANLRWLSGYRHRRFAPPGLAARLGEVFAEPGQADHSAAPTAPGGPANSPSAAPGRPAAIHGDDRYGKSSS